MKSFQVSLTKNYLLSINAENKEQAKQFAEFFTSDISDISDEINRAEYNFRIKEIECVTNEAFDVEESKE